MNQTPITAAAEVEDFEMQISAISVASKVLTMERFLPQFLIRRLDIEYFLSRAGCLLTTTIVYRFAKHWTQSSLARTDSWPESIVSSRTFCLCGSAIAEKVKKFDKYTIFVYNYSSYYLRYTCCTRLLPAGASRSSSGRPSVLALHIGLRLRLLHPENQT